jgi:hypothetical protein
MFDVSRLPDGPAHFVLVSCDGDFAEMVKKVLAEYPDMHVSILATPMMPKKSGRMNYLSSRFKELGSHDRYELLNIGTIKDFVSKPQQTK